MTQVFTHFITPILLLQPYIRYFAIRKFDTNGHEFPKAVVAENENIVTFFLHSKLFGFHSPHEKAPAYVLKKNDTPECCFTGIQTFSKGFIVFKGMTNLLCIHFKPTGFFQIFNISPKEILDKLGDLDTILSKEILLMHEQMHDATDIMGCIKVAECYLSRRLQNQRSKCKLASITTASQFLIKMKGIYSIKQLACDCNMTVQTFEVHFAEQVGIGAKYFSRLVRFNSAINRKLYEPQKTWTDIAHLSGYYDQMHLIKDFKEFSSLSPNQFMKEMHPPIETFQ